MHVKCSNIFERLRNNLVHQHNQEYTNRKIVQVVVIIIQIDLMKETVFIISQSKAKIATPESISWVKFYP